MENITVGQIAIAVAFLAALITGGVKIKDAVKKWLETLLKNKFDELEKSINDLKKTIDNVDLENCKNYLVTFLAEIERGEVKDEIEIQRFYEELGHYTEQGGNSYIKEKYAKIKSKGLL